ncbi:MAG: SEC-C metal-binding domain-containing protein [Enterobacterales bacterium]|nr:SEC-C metal-binding domain-containing protein [Enterobacterales bacterium]
MQNNQSNEAVDKMMSTFITLALNTSDPLECCQRLRKIMPQFEPDFFAQPGQDLMVFWFAFQMWNNFPHPKNDFKPIKIEPPKRNLPCYCGSGKKYKHCCVGVPYSSKIPKDVFWPFFAEQLPDTSIFQAAKQFQLPMIALEIFAANYLENDEPQKAVKLLKPYFADKGKHLNSQSSGLVDICCDAFDRHYASDKNKLDMLQGLIHHASKIVKSEALQRLASITMDNKDVKGALNLLYQAIKVNPSDLSSSVLEIQFLVVDKQIDHAKQRASFWLAKVQRSVHGFEKIEDFLQLAKKDPQAAIIGFFNQDEEDQRSVLLLSLLKKQADLTEDAFRLENMGEEADSKQTLLRLEESASLDELVEEWIEVSPLSRHMMAGMPQADNLWDDPDEVEWLEFLMQNPAALNSVQVLNGILEILAQHPSRMFPVSPVLQQVQAIAEKVVKRLQQKLESQPADSALTWMFRENRPIISILTHLIHLQPNETDKQPWLELYLRLNPNDNHGLRCLLINQRIRQQDYHQALELSDSYPDDGMLDMLMGTALCHYILADESKAKALLLEMLDNRPHVIPALIRDKVSKPKLDSFGVSYGGKDEAWLYRAEMRDVWKTTPGALDWLKKVHKQIDYSR